MCREGGRHTKGERYQEEEIDRHTNKQREREKESKRERER
jgi:hypothetical protein